MSWDDVDSYWRAATVLEAREALQQLKIADFPHIKKEDRKRYHRELHRQAYPRLEGQKDADELSTEQLADRIKAVLGG